MRLQGRVALVTGSSRGIGAAIALRLGADGAKVIVHAGTRADRARQVADSIKAGGGDAAVLVGDLSSGEEPGRIVQEAFGVHGALDILVNNAAISGSVRITDHTPGSVDLEIGLNLRAVILTTSWFARLTRSPHGRIINISSPAGRHAAFGRSVYSATKGAIEAFTRSVALELGERQITVNAVAPGITATDLLEDNEQQHEENWRALFARWTALGRVGEPSDIADIVAFVASDEARWLTGTTVSADGGLVTTGTNIALFTR